MSALAVSFNSLIDSVSDSENAVQGTFKECYDTALDVIMHSATPSEDALNIKTCMNELAETQKDMASLAKAMAAIKPAFEASTLNQESACDLFNERFQQHLQRADINQNQKEWLTAVQNVIKNRDGPEDDEDSELLVTKKKQSFKDPLTQCMIENPMRSIICNHVFEKNSIMKYLQNSRKSCPYSGCVSEFTKEDLLPDREMKILLSQMKDEENSD